MHVGHVRDLRISVSEEPRDTREDRAHLEEGRAVPSAEPADGDIKPAEVRI